MSIYAASDALGSLGLDWDVLTAKLPVDAISVYAGSAMGQLDDAGAGGMLKARYRGNRLTSKYCPLGLAQMPADFVNAYVLGAAGSTGATLGACASFLYNLRHAIHDIRQGRARIALVGAAEAPVTSEVMEGYAAMGALATDKELRALDGLGDDAIPDHRRACRPFGENCGFTIGESAQFLILFDDELAMETGAPVLGAAADVFVNADGYKKSIAGPGVGNYLTVAKATACARAIVGEKALRRGGIVHAHGTGTPQNRGHGIRDSQPGSGPLRHRSLAGGRDQSVCRPLAGGGERGSDCRDARELGPGLAAGNPHHGRAGRGRGGR